MASPSLHAGMQYRCTSCKETFDVPSGDKPRCPKCLRIHNVEPLKSKRKKASQNRGPIIFFAIIAIGVGSYMAWYFSQGEDEEPEEERTVEIGPLSEEELRDYLKNRRVKGSDIVIPFAESDEVKAFAQKAARGKASDGEKAQALLDALRERVSDNHEHYISISPRGSKILSPSETLAALQSDDPYEPYAFEIAALMVTACRSIGVPAVLAEVHQFANSKAPTDGSGVQGYYVAALPRGESYRRPILYDPTSGRFEDSAEAEAEVMTDGEAVSASMTLRALWEAAHNGNASRAERLSSKALDLRSGSATALAARGTVRLLGGGGQLSAGAALEEYERALRIRPDPQRKVLAARILLAPKHPRRAEEMVRSALTEADECAAAHAILGLIHLSNQRVEEAQASLLTAEQLSPRDPHIALMWVQYHVAQQDLETAMEAAQAVVDRIPNDPQPRLMLAQILYEDARYDAAEQQFRELLRRNPDNSQLRDLLREAFEYDPAPDDLEGDAGPVRVAAVEEESGDAGIGEVDVDGGASDFRLKMGSGPGKVRLGGPSGFQLNVR